MPITLASGTEPQPVRRHQPVAQSDAANPNEQLLQLLHRQSRYANVTTRNPAPANTWGYDADIVQADNILTNGSTNACLRLKTNGDQYFPDVVTTAIELPSPKIVADESRHRSSTEATSTRAMSSSTGSR